MNVSHDEYGPFGVEQLMAIHNENMTKRFTMVLEGTIADIYVKSERNISKEHNPADLSSHEGVEGRSKQSSMIWTSVRNARKGSTYTKPIKGPRPPVYLYAGSNPSQ